MKITCTAAVTLLERWHRRYLKTKTRCRTTRRTYLKKIHIIYKIVLKQKLAWLHAIKTSNVLLYIKVVNVFGRILEGSIHVHKQLWIFSHRERVNICAPKASSSTIFHIYSTYFTISRILYILYTIFHGITVLRIWKSPRKLNIKNYRMLK